MKVLYRIIKWLVQLFYPKIQVEGAQNLPETSAIIVANHCQMHGPIAFELHYPRQRYTWCAGQMMKCKDVPAYAYADFWCQKPKWQRPFFQLLSYIIAPIAACVFPNAQTIGVYRDGRILSTFKNTVKRLQEGADVVIFPEEDVPYDPVLCRFQENFTDVAKLYYKRTGKAVSFVPVYLAPNLRKMYIGKPVAYDPQEPMDTQRSRICGVLMERIVEMARSLPRHRVVPYRNMGKKHYPYNIPQEVTDYENARC